MKGFTLLLPFHFLQLSLDHREKFQADIGGIALGKIYDMNQDPMIQEAVSDPYVHGFYMIYHDNMANLQQVKEKENHFLYCKTINDPDS